MNFWQRRKQRNHLQALLHHARGLRHMREDLLPPAELSALDAAIQGAVQAHRSRDDGALPAACESLGARIEALTPPCAMPGWRENFEVLVVALGVAMAFRAYFYQPFQIPTGSMQPTLYGISSVEQAAPRTRDLPGMKMANWLWAGEWFTQVETRRPGKVAVLWGDDRVPGYTTVACGRWPGALPTEAVIRREAPLVRLLASVGGRVGLSWFDRGYELYFLPNDVCARQTGLFQRNWVPDAPRQKQTAESLRQLAYWMQAAAAPNATDEARAMAWQKVAPVVTALVDWAQRTGSGREAAWWNAVLVAYRVCE